MDQEISINDLEQCHWNQATHTITSKCNVIPIGGRSTLDLEYLDFTPYRLRLRFPKHGDVVLLACKNAPSVVVRRYDETEAYDISQSSKGLIFPDTPEGMKAARKKAGLDQ
jgi:hypothetical protein